jgi:hypothetical protein
METKTSKQEKEDLYFEEQPQIAEQGEGEL